jgi:protein TonB
MTAIVLNYGLNWGFANNDDTRFKRIARNNLLVALLLSILIPFLPLPELAPPPVEEQPERLVKLIFEKEIVPPPPPPQQQVVKEPEILPKKVEKPKPLPKKAEAPKPVKPEVSAREKAQKAGLLALSDSLSDLRDDTVTQNFAKKGMSTAGGNAVKTERAILTAGTTRSSGGIQTAGLSRNTGGGGLAGRSTTAVQGPAGTAAGGGGGAVGGKGKGDRAAGRSIEEIQMVFDRNKGSIYSVYNRALRANPTLQGKVVLKLTIAPSGKVTHCSVVSSELGDADLGGKITSRVKLFDFGAKDVAEVTITYPIDFLPA